MYVTGLGFKLLGTFEGHNGFDGAIIGHGIGPGELGVQRGGVGTFVAHLVQDGTQIQTGFDQVGAVAAAQGVRGGGLVDATTVQDGLEGLLLAAAGC